MFVVFIKKEKVMKNKLWKLLDNHPVQSLLVFFVGMPVFILVTVSISTTLTILPFAWLLGLL